MDKKLFTTRNEIYKKCPSVFWEVSTFAILIAIALIALDAVVPGLYIATFGIIFFPLLFATFMTLFSIKYGGIVTVKSTFAISRAYFSRGNFGCFRIMRCFFHALIVYFIASGILTIILEPIFINIYGSSFTELLESLYENFYNDFDATLEIMNGDNPVALYYSCTTSFSLSSAAIAFIFGICFNSMNVYLCANIPNATAGYCTAVFGRFLKGNVKSYRKDFWSLNWPVFALLVFGIAAGYIFTFLLDIDFTYASVISSMAGLLCVIPFAPFFFANMEALFAKYSENMKNASTDLTQGFLKNLRDNVNLSDEDKAKIDELLSKGIDPQNSDDDDKKDE